MQFIITGLGTTREADNNTVQRRDHHININRSQGDGAGKLDDK